MEPNQKYNIYYTKIWNIPKNNLMQIERVSSLIQAQFKTLGMVTMFLDLWLLMKLFEIFTCHKKLYITQHYIIISNISKFNVELDQN